MSALGGSALVGGVVFAKSCGTIGSQGGLVFTDRLQLVKLH